MSKEHDQQLAMVEAMLERVLNSKGRVQIKAQPWWWNMLTFVLGVISATLLWVWTGKADLDNTMRLLRSNMTRSDQVHEGLTNYVKQSVTVLGSRVNRIASQSWTKDQMYVWGQKFERSNSNQFSVPDVDEIRRQFPLQLE